MTEQGTGPGGPGSAGRQPTEEELQAAYEAELKRIRVDDVLIQTVVSLLNLGGRRAGLAPGTENERDLDQVRLAVDAARALLPLVEDKLGPRRGHAARRAVAAADGLRAARRRRRAGGRGRDRGHAPAGGVRRARSGPVGRGARAGAAQRTALGARAVAHRAGGSPDLRVR